jgi:ribosomal protein L37AE/L43A
MYNDLLLRNAAVDVCGDENDNYCAACGEPAVAYCKYEGRWLCEFCGAVWDFETEEPNE